MRIVFQAGMGVIFLLLFIRCDYTRASRQLDFQADANQDTLSQGIDSLSEGLVDTLPESFDTSAYTRLLRQLSVNQTEAPWPVSAVYPNAGALLPFYRIIAFYGNLYSRKMGILGELPPMEMLIKLKAEVAAWDKADTSIQAIPALHYIAVTAQREPGKQKKYRMRMPGSEINKILAIADSADALVFLDIQVGHSTLPEEIPELTEYLKMPHVHLGIDPEYSMKGGEVPGDKVGTMDAEDINYAISYLADLVRTYRLPPKVLVVHRFKKSMVTNYSKIKIVPEVQIVMHMDGFGSRGKKRTTYKQSITAEPVQFAGFKLFYKNDARDPVRPTIMQPEEVLKLHPVPVYIQYQ